jgi:hypothetical protein
VYDDLYQQLHCGRSHDDDHSTYDSFLSFRDRRDWRDYRYRGHRTRRRGRYDNGSRCCGRRGRSWFWCHWDDWIGRRSGRIHWHFC